MTTIKTTDLVDEVLSLDAQIAELEDQRKLVADKLIKRLGVGGSVENESALVTAVQNTSYTVDYDALVAAKPRWALRVTKRVLDQAKFTKLRQAEVLPVAVAELVVAKLSDPYLRITRR